MAGQFPDPLLMYLPLTHAHGGGSQIDGQFPEFTLYKFPLRHTHGGGGGGLHGTGQFPESSLT